MALGTAQTIASLNSTWSDPGFLGRNRSIDILNLIATLKKRSSTYEITDKEYGAIGDGSSHPLSGITLWGGTNTTGFTAAQWNTLIYGTTTPTLGAQSITIASTAAEMDGVALQFAIWSAAGNKGGLVTMAAGHYRLNQTIYMPNTALVNNNTPTTSVNLLGDGRENTILEWLADLGVGTFAITIVSRAVAFPASAGYWQDFTICGPNAGVALGVKPANMHGLGWASGRVMHRIGIIGVNAGFCIPTGDQTQFYDVRTWNCYYGTYFDISSSATGDMMFERYSSNTNMRACIGVSNVSEITGCIWIKGFLGTSPYAIFKEGGGANTYVIGESKFIHCQFEQVGNSCIGDGMAIGAHTCYTSGQIEFDYCQFSPNTAYKIAAETATGFVCSILQNGGQISVRYPTYLGSISFAGFTSGFFEIDAPNAGIELTGDLDQLFGTVLSGLPLGKSGGAPVQGSYKLHNVGAGTGPTGKGGGWEGTVCFANANPTLAIGNIVAGDSSGNRTVALSAGTTGEQILGIVVLPHTVSGGWVCVAQSGYAPLVLSSGALTNGTWVRAGASGLAVASGTKFPTLSSNIGVWGNAAVTPNRGTCILQGLV